jgi:hypothetical protein
MHRSKAFAVFLLGLLALATGLSCKNPISPHGTPGDVSAKLPARSARGADGTLELYLSSDDGKGHRFSKDDLVAWGHHHRFSHHRGDRHFTEGHGRHFPLGDRQVTNLWITILSIEVRGKGSGWTTVYTNPEGDEYDLLEISGDMEYLSSMQLASGHYTEIRLILGSDNRVTLAGVDYPLVVPGSDRTGLKIGGKFRIKENTATTVVLDFDAQQSLKPIGRGKYLLKPVLRIEDVSYEESEVSDNNPPSVSFPPTGYEVSGAGSSDVDGNYTETGAFDSNALYSQSGGSFLLFNYWAGIDPVGNPDEVYRRWQINSDTPDTKLDPPALNTIPYYGPANPTSPEGAEGAYTAGSGTGSGPTVLRMPISGNAAVGNELTAHYIFSDPDVGDTDASTFQWYRFTNSTDTTGGTAIPDAKSYEYTTVKPDDALMWLRIQVTPVDSRGAVGTPVLSDPLQVLASS